MKAIVYRTYGSPDVLTLEEVPKPDPRDDDVRVKVHAASVNSWGWDRLQGKSFFVRLEGPLRPHYEILGCDIAGRVDAVGKNVKRLRPGDEVFGDISGCGWGGFAEYACAREDVLALKSASMTFEQAAAIPHAGLLALQGLRTGRQLQPGQRLLINGAGGGAGTFALQMAKSYGVEVTCVDSAKKLEMLRSLGADHVIDYIREDYTRSGRQYDLILDMVARRSVLDYRRALRPNGSYVMVGGSAATVFSIMIFGSLLSLNGSKKIGVLTHIPNREDLDRMTELFEAGTVKPVIDSRYPLREVPDAMRRLGEGHSRGKVIVTVDHDDDAA